MTVLGAGRGCAEGGAREWVPQQGKGAGPATCMAPGIRGAEGSSPPLPYAHGAVSVQGGCRTGEGAGGGPGGEGPARNLQPGRRCRCVRDARPQGRERGGAGHSSTVSRPSAGSAPLATVVSLPTARAARPPPAGDTPKQRKCQGSSDKCQVIAHLALCRLALVAWHFVAHALTPARSRGSCTTARARTGPAAPRLSCDFPATAPAPAR